MVGLKDLVGQVPDGGAWLGQDKIILAEIFSDRLVGDRSRRVVLAEGVGSRNSQPQLFLPQDFSGPFRKNVDAVGGHQAEIDLPV